MKNTFILISAILLSFSVKAQPKWAENVSSIIYSKCSNCHNSNGIAPFTLMSYQDAVNEANDIKTAVTSKVMPPWPPDPAYNRLAHERILSTQEITAIRDWVDAGTPRGDINVEPAPPVFSNTNEITNPDLTLTIPSFTVNTTDDLYRCFVLPTGLTATKYLTGLETVPGDRSIVHHVLIYSDTSSTPLTLDANDPGPGYTNFGGTGSNSSKLIGVWVPGQSAYFFPPGMGVKLQPNANIILQIHYPGGISNRTDATKILMKTTTSLVREIAIDAPLTHFNLDNGFLYIPANTVRTFTSHFDLTADISAIAVGPHMHLIGKSIKSWAVTPTNDTLPFIDIPEWDFHWQGMYSFQRVVKLPAGTTLYSSATYDNTTNNPDNPNNPPRPVTLGEGTEDEMMLVYFTYTYYLPGDENIILDSSIVTSLPAYKQDIVSTLQLYEVFPNPVRDEMTIQYLVPSAEDVVISITDVSGKQIKRIVEMNASGLVTRRISMGELAAGNYLLNISDGEISRTKRFIKE